MYQNLKCWPPKKCELQSFVFQKVPIWQRLLANQLGGIEYNFSCLKRLFRKVRRKLRSAFSLKSRFLKIRLLVTLLKCLIYFMLTFCWHFCVCFWQAQAFLLHLDDLVVEEIWRFYVTLLRDILRAAPSSWFSTQPSSWGCGSCECGDTMFLTWHVTTWSMCHVTL